VKVGVGGPSGVDATAQPLPAKSAAVIRAVAKSWMIEAELLFFMVPSPRKNHLGAAPLTLHWPLPNSVQQFPLGILDGTPPRAGETKIANPVLFSK